MGQPTAWESSLRVASAQLSAKRRAARSPIDCWYPYYAGFSYSFARNILGVLPIPQGGTVLDPWNGSGTTTAAGLHLGFEALGLDLNPSTVVLARAKLASQGEILAVAKGLRHALDDAHETFRRRGPASQSDPLKDWLPPTAAAFLRAALNAVCDLSGVSSLVDLPPRHALTAVCLLAAGRELAIQRRTANATWTRPMSTSRPVRISALERLALGHAQKVMQDAPFCPTTRSDRAKCVVGDSRRMEVASEGIHAILGSPPYCTRIDYAKQMAFEHAALCQSDGHLFRPLRDSLMGTTTIRRAGGVTAGLPGAIETLLDQVAGHPSHRSASYYARNLRQYFHDAALSVAEIARVLKPGGYAVLVLQNSYYKEIEIPLSSCFRQLASAFGLDGTTLARQPVARAMTAVNTRARSYSATRQYTEDVILLRK